LQKSIFQNEGLCRNLAWTGKREIKDRLRRRSVLKNNTWEGAEGKEGFRGL